MWDYLSPRKIESFKSQVNGSIEVVRSFGQYLIYINSVQQSGPWEEKVWKKALLTLQEFNPNSHKVENILILGLGAGNLAKLLAVAYNNSKLTGVEIDRQIINVGKKYFSLAKVSNLKVRITDAFKFMARQKTTYDLIFVDLFIGVNSPDQIESDVFLEGLSQTMSKNALVIFNRLTTKTANFVLEDFVDKLQKFFKIEKTVKVDFNIIIICSRKLA